jgi:hypothetical protein
MTASEIEYWVTCMLDPWPALAHDDAFGEIVDALRDEGEYLYDEVELSLEEGAPSFVPVGSVVIHVLGPKTANWDEVLELLDAIAAAGEGVVFAEDRQIVLDRRSARPGTKAFKESPAWAQAVARKLPGLRVRVSGTRSVADPARELERAGLSELANRIKIAHVDGTLEITAQLETDALVAGQVLAHAARGSAIALGVSGETHDLPR